MSRHHSSNYQAWPNQQSQWQYQQQQQQPQQEYLPQQFIYQPQQHQIHNQQNYYQQPQAQYGYVEYSPSYNGSYESIPFVQSQNSMSTSQHAYMSQQLPQYD